MKFIFENIDGDGRTNYARVGANYYFFVLFMVNQSTGSGSLIADVAEFITEEDGTTVAFENDIDDVSGEKNPDPYNDEDGTGVLERRMDAVFVFTGHLLSSSTSEEMSGITSTNDDADDENAIDNDENDPMDDADSEASAMNEKATQGAYATDIHPYENWIVSAGCDDAAYMWDPSNGECLIECRNHTDSVIACQFSHDGQYLATAGMDGKVCVYEASQSKLLFEFNELHEVTALCWHPRGPVLVAGTVDGTLWMWSMPQGKVMHVICTTQSSVTCLNFCPNGKFLLSGNQNSLFTLHDPKTGTVVWTLSKEDKRWHQGAVTCFRVVNEVVVCGGEGGGLLLLQLASGKLIGSLGGHSESIESLDFCPRFEG